jgi:hypothetical protein
MAFDRRGATSADGNLGRSRQEEDASMLRHVLVVLVGTALTLGTTTPAAASQQPNPSDPLVVAESFLLARNARDPWAASALCSPLLAIQDAQGQWIADPTASRDWFRRLTDTYTIDMLVHPRAEGDRVAWVERLAPRSLPFPQALQQSLEVQVEVVVQDGKITSYTAPYPVLAARPAQAATTQSLGSAASLNQPVVPPAVAFLGSALALAAVVVLVMSVGPIVRRGRGSASST